MITFKYFVFYFIAHFVCTSVISAQAPENATEDIPIEVKKHVKALFVFDEKTLTQTYAEKVRLMPGHEALKPKYGIADDPKRIKPIISPAKKIIQFAKKMNSHTLDSKKEALQVLKGLVYDNLEINTGDYAIAPSDAIKTPDGKLHFQIIRGDKLIKVMQPGGFDFILLQVRNIDGKWKVVAEYID